MVGACSSLGCTWPYDWLISEESSECHLGQYFSRMTILTLDWHFHKVDKCFSLLP